MFISKSEKKDLTRRLDSLEHDRWAARTMTCQDAAKLTRKIEMLYEYLNVAEHHTHPKVELKKRKGKQ